jgi:hypothetical protein
MASLVASPSGRLAAAVLRREEGHSSGVTALAYDGLSDTLLSGDIQVSWQHRGEMREMRGLIEGLV